MKYIMKNNKLYENGNHARFNYCLYSEDWKYLGQRQLTPKQALALKLEAVSPMQVFKATKGTMGFKNLPPEKLAQMEEQYAQQNT